MKKHRKLLLILLLVCLVIPMGVLAAEDWQVLLARPTGGGLVSTGGDYQLAGAVGQADAGRLYGSGYRVNGGVMGEIFQTGERLIFLPLTLRFTPITVYESEPNDYYSQANMLDTLPVRVLGNHDGSLDTGDVYQLAMLSGQLLRVTLATGDTNGVQLLAYDSAGVEVVRDFEAPFSLSVTTTYDGLYYLYVFTPAEANNSASYALIVWLSGQAAQASILAPTMDIDQLEQAPLINP